MAPGFSRCSSPDSLIEAKALVKSAHTDVRFVIPAPRMNPRCDRPTRRQRGGIRAKAMVGLGGLEPPASPLSGVRSNHLSYRPKSRSQWWSLSGSNRRPPACKAGALPAELRPQCLGHSGCRSLVRTPDRLLVCLLVSKGGDPAAPSDTATLLRLHPSHRPHRGKRPPEG